MRGSYQQKLTACINESGMTRAQLAYIIGALERDVVAWECGDLIPEKKYQLELSRALNLKEFVEVV